jgi:Domain of unknown function (DUF4340)
MQFRNTLIVLILLVLVGGYIYFFQAGKPEEETKKLFDIKADDITRLVLKYPGQEIELERTGGAWKMVKPIQTDADASAVGTLTQEIANADVKRTVDEHPTDLAPFGLDKPAATLVVSTKDKTLPGVAVGKNAPIGYSVYIRTTDSPAVMLTSGAFGPGTKRTVSDLRDHTLMSFKPDDVTKMIVKQDDGTPVELEKEQGTWKIAGPAKYDADPERVRTLLTSLSNARIDDFAADKPANAAQYGLDKPALTVSVFSGPAQSRQLLEFGKREPGAGKDDYYVRRGEKPNVYTVHTYVFTDADKGLNDLRDRTVLALNSDQVEQVKFISGGKSFAVARSAGGKWTETDGGKSAADPAKVRQFIDRMRDLKAETIVQDSTANLDKFGLNAPGEEVTFLGKDGKLLASVKLATIVRHNENDKNAPARTDYYALSGATPTVYKLFEYDYTDLIKTPDQLATPRPAAPPAPRPTAAK